MSIPENERAKVYRVAADLVLLHGGGMCMAVDEAYATIAGKGNGTPEIMPAFIDDYTDLIDLWDLDDEDMFLASLPHPDKPEGRMKRVEILKRLASILEGNRVAA